MIHLACHKLSEVNERGGLGFHSKEGTEIMRAINESIEEKDSFCL